MRPTWNKHPFTCPRCKRRWDTMKIRLANHRGTLYCHGCANTLGGQTRPDELDDNTCSTCKQPLEPDQRRRLTKAGYWVHHRCPRRMTDSRQATRGDQLGTGATPETAVATTAPKVTNPSGTATKPMVRSSRQPRRPIAAVNPPVGGRGTAG